MGIFDKFKGQDRRARGNYIYLGVGQYYLRVEKLVFRDARDKENQSKADQFIAELTVLHVLSDDNAEHKVGDRVSWMATNAGKFGDSYFLPNISSFVLGATGIDLSQMEEGEAFGALEEMIQKQSLTGSFVESNGFVRPPKEGDDPKKKAWPAIQWKGQVSAQQLVEAMPEEAINRFFPDGSLLDLVAEEQKETAPASK